MFKYLPVLDVAVSPIEEFAYTLQKSWVPVVLIIAGSIFVGLGGFNTEDVKYVVFALCVLCALYLTVDGYKKYSKARRPCAT